MAEQTLVVSQFYGGIAPGEKVGPPGAFGKGSECLDIFKDPNKFTVLPGGSKVSGSTVTGLIKWIVDASPHDTNRYFYDEDGKIYRETSGGTWSELRDVANSIGQGMAVSNDYIYYTQNTQIGRYGPLAAGSPTFTDNWQTGLNDTSTSKFAPILPFKEGFAVGHGNKLAWWDGSTWDVDRLVLPPGFEIRSLVQVQEFIVIGAWRGGGSIVDSEEGFVFFWDGSSTFANYFFPTDGAPNALGNTRNRLISVQGSSGNIYTDQEPFNLVHQIPNLDFGKYLEINPGAITTWKGQTYIGSAASTDSTAVKHGIYSWGSKSSAFPEALNYAFLLSTGTKTGTDVRIGALLGVGNQLYWSWEDNNTFGVDKVTSSSEPADQGIYQSLVHDDGRPGHDKMPMYIKITHEPLRTGESITVGGKADRASSFTNGDANSVAGSQETLYTVPGTRYKNFEFQVLLGCGATAPSVTGIDYIFDDLRQEKRGFS